MGGDLSSVYRQNAKREGGMTVVLSFYQSMDSTNGSVCFNSRFLKEQGRKIAKEKCVEKPNMTEIFDCATLLKFQTALELDKAYCRDYWQRGRIRVRLFDKNGKPVREDIPSSTFNLPSYSTSTLFC